MPLRIASKANGIGELYAHLFENELTAIKRGLFWAITLPCATVEWDGDKWETSLSCEWLQWRVRRWPQLGGATLASSVAPHMAECSFYLAEHHPVTLSSLRLKAVPGAPRFRVRLEGSVDLRGFGELDGEGIPISVEAEAELSGIIVVPDNLSPKPVGPTGVAEVLSPFIDLDDFHPPVRDGFRYVFAPRCSAA